jgi:serine/threonine protein kinase
VSLLLLPLLAGVPESTAHGFACDLFSALKHTHHHGICHRDVKLANLLLAADGTLRLADFGHAAVCAAPVGTDAARAAHGDAADDDDDRAGAADGTQLRLHEKNGTKSYCAPEVPSRPPHHAHGMAGAWWAWPSTVGCDGASIANGRDAPPRCAATRRPPHCERA